MLLERVTGALGFGWIADRFGRRLVFYVTPRLALDKLSVCVLCNAGPSEPTIVTSSPSRIQVTPSARIERLLSQQLTPPSVVRSRADKRPASAASGWRIGKLSIPPGECVKIRTTAIC